MQSTNGAAHAELTPLRFLERASMVFPDRVAIVDGPRRITYREFACEATRLANGLVVSGIEPGARVAYLCPNTAPLLIAKDFTYYDKHLTPLNLSDGSPIFTWNQQ